MADAVADPSVQGSMRVTGSQEQVAGSLKRRAKALEQGTGQESQEQDDEIDARLVKKHHQERTTCYFQGYKYTRAWTSSKKVVYRCSSFRRTECKGTMEYNISTMGYSIARPHTCQVTQSAFGISDGNDEMKAKADSLAFADVARPVREIWQELRSIFYGNGSNVMVGLSESQVINRVYRERSLHYSGNVHGSVEIPPLSLALNESESFFQFQFVSANRQDVNSSTRLLGWAYPALVNLLRYHNVSLFIDGTFRCVPRNFQQCVVYMVHDRASGLFVPVFYILSTSRCADAYWDMMHFVFQPTDQQLSSGEVICDFESALMQAVQTQFCDAIVLDCLYHLKQELRRAMKRYAILDAECAKRGVIDMLTVAARSSELTWNCLGSCRN